MVACAKGRGKRHLVRNSWLAYRVVYLAAVRKYLKINKRALVEGARGAHVCRR